MRIVDLLARLNQLDIHLQLENRQLKIDAPKGVLSGDLLTELKDNKAAIIDFLEENLRRQVRYAALEPAEAKDYYALSSAQRRLYFHQQMDLHGTVYNMPEMIEIKNRADFDIQPVEKTFKKLIHRHESLRTSFLMVTDEPVQKIQRETAFAVEYHDVCPDAREPLPYPAEPQAIIKDFVRPFDLAGAPLLRARVVKMAPNHTLLLVDTHHIVSDEFSHHIMIADFVALYLGKPLSPLKLRYKDFSAWQNRLHESGEIKRQKEYWLKEFAGEIPVLHLPYDFPRRPLAGFAGNTLRAALGTRETGALKEMAKTCDVTLFMLLLAVYQVFLSKLGGQDDLVVGAATAGRRHAELEKIIGVFINFLPFRHQPSPPLTFSAFLNQVKEKVVRNFENQDYPFEDLVKDLEIQREAGHHPLTDVGFALQRLETAGLPGGTAPPAEKTGLPGMAMQTYTLGTQTSKFDLSLFVVETPEEFVLSFEYGTALFTEETMVRFSAYFKHTVSALVTDPRIRLADVEIIPEEERKRLLIDFNDNSVDFCSDKTVYQGVETQAKQNPHRLALGCGEGVLTYRELNRQANRLAVVLREQGIRADRLVGILMNRSPRMAVGILAVWKAGGAYIPLDPQYPRQRVDGIMADSGAAVLLVRSQENGSPAGTAGTGKYRPIRWENVLQGGPLPPTANPRGAADMGALAYVIYTSGSTGKPKGAMVEHRGMMNHMHAKVHDLQLTAASIIAQNASHTFDISVWQFFAALILGGKTIVYPEEIIMDPRVFLTQIVNHQLTILEVVPSYLAAALDALVLSGYQLQLPLHYLLVTGEEVKRPLVWQWFDIFPRSKLVNAYGPTEASDDITHFIMDRVPDRDQIPIGKPLPNLDIYIVDDHKKLCPLGVKGEICVSGVGVGRGYLNNPELTFERFINKKLLRGVQGGGFLEKSPPGRRRQNIYKTGDLGRWLPDGTIEFFGRKDHQVKIRGFRIELGEIESRLVSHPGIKEAAVAAREDENGAKYLCAYVVTTGKTGAAELGPYLLQTLPDYMVPAHFLELERMPLTANGKIDRQRLPGPGLSSPPPGTIPTLTRERVNEAPAAEPPRDDRPSAAQLDRLHDQLLAQLKKEQALVREYSRQTGKKLYLLSYTQRMFYTTEKTHAGTGSENLGYSARYRELLDGDLLAEAINLALLKNEGLRLRMVEMQDEAGASFLPLQYVSPYRRCEPDRVDFSGENSEKRAKEWIDRKMTETFPLVDSDLFYFASIRFNERESGYFMKFHHIIFDDWTASLVMTEVDRYYDTLKAGNKPAKTPNPSYLDFIAHQQEYLASPRAKADRWYWHHALRPLPENAGLFSKLGESAGIQGNVLELPFPPALRDRLHQCGKTMKTSLYKLILSSFAIYIRRFTGLDDMVIGTVNHGRSTAHFQQIPGVFINFFPLRLTLHPDMAVRDFLAELGKTVNQVVKNHLDFPSDLLADEIRETTGMDTRYWLNLNLVGHADRLKNEKFKLTYHASLYQPNPLMVHINISNRDIDGLLELEWNYQSERFSDQEIRGIHQGLVNILADALENPGKRVADVELLSPAEKRYILDHLCRQSDANLPAQETGRAIAAYILSEEGHLQPPGVPGDLWIGGSGANPAGAGQSGGTFLKDPFAEDSMIYKTEELACWRHDGTLARLGNRRRQVWLEGLRVDLETVEKHLLRHDDIKEAVVVAKQPRRGDKYPAAYIISGKELEYQEIRRCLAAVLPPYMIPPLIARLEEMPLTPAGEINRRLLARLDIDTLPGTRVELPTNETEKKLLEIAAEILGIEKTSLGIGDDFFKRGGNSLKLIMLVSRIYKEFGVEVPLTQIYYNPLIKQIAQSIGARNISDQPVVLLNRLTPKKVFAFPPQIGYGINYTPLAARLADYSLYAFSFIEDEDRISQYVDILTGIQEQGPYVFLGYSAAGPLTLQVSKALEERGYEVSDLIFLDCFPRLNGSRVPDEAYMTEFRRFVDRFLEGFDALFLREKVLEKSQRYMNYYSHVTHLEPVQARVHLILSEEAQIRRGAPNWDRERESWEPYTRKTQAVYRGKGMHQEMFNSGGPLETNGEIMKKILATIVFAPPTTAEEAGKDEKKMNHV